MLVVTFSALFRVQIFVVSEITFIMPEISFFFANVNFFVNCSLVENIFMKLHSHWPKSLWLLQNLINYASHLAVIYLTLYSNYNSGISGYEILFDLNNDLCSSWTDKND